MSKPKTLEKWEQQFAVLFTGEDVDLTQELTIDEFTARFLDEVNYPRTGIDFKGRTEWLEYNGYDVTRENMVADLPTVVLPKEMLIDNAPGKRTSKK